MLEKTLESPLDCKEIQSVHPKGDQSWVFIGRTDVEAEAPILWPPDAESWFIRKDPDAGKDWRLEEKGSTEDEMAGWHHWVNAHEFVWTLGVGDGQGGLKCCSPWGHKESDTTEQLNWTGTGKDWKQEVKRMTGDGWMASPTQCTWVWANSGRWWRTGKPGVLQSMGSQGVRHNWATEQQQKAQRNLTCPQSRNVWTYSVCLQIPGGSDGKESVCN